MLILEVGKTGDIADNLLDEKLRNRKISFSFEYYDARNKDYCLSNWNREQIARTLERLKDVSTKNFFDMRQQRWVYHFAEVDWAKTKCKGGFPNQSISSLPAFHFALIGVNNQLARVYGAYSQGVFYVVWFDLNHNIWPTPLKHT